MKTTTTTTNNNNNHNDDRTKNHLSNNVKGIIIIIRFWRSEKFKEEKAEREY